jgi:signal transduction histidine kinase
MNNALKHSVANELDINITSDERALYIEVKDNGIGYNTETPSTGYGLKSINKRLALIEASSTISSSNTGTQINIVLPLI